MACGNSAADEFLDSYERVVDRYVLYMENVKNGNPDEQALKDILRESQEMQMKAAELEGAKEAICGNHTKNIYRRNGFILSPFYSPNFFFNR